MKQRELTRLRELVNILVSLRGYGYRCNSSCKIGYSFHDNCFSITTVHYFPGFSINISPYTTIYNKVQYNLTPTRTLRIQRESAPLDAIIQLSTELYREFKVRHNSFFTDEDLEFVEKWKDVCFARNIIERACLDYLGRLLKYKENDIVFRGICNKGDKVYLREITGTYYVFYSDTENSDDIRYIEPLEFLLHYEPDFMVDMKEIEDETIF